MALQSTPIRRSSSHLFSLRRLIFQLFLSTSLILDWQKVGRSLIQQLKRYLLISKLFSPIRRILRSIANSWIHWKAPLQVRSLECFEESIFFCFLPRFSSVFGCPTSRSHLPSWFLSHICWRIPKYYQLFEGNHFLHLYCKFWQFSLAAHHLLVCPQVAHISFRGRGCKWKEKWKCDIVWNL